jgi:autotransporter-associated beta strand protein
VGLLSPPAYAATLSWSGGGGANANWNLAANWGGAGIPGNGDTIIFQGPQPNLVNTNNIAGLTLNQIRFQGTSGGFDLRGNAFTLTNNIECTNSAGANTLENNITLAIKDQIIDVPTTLTLSGVLSGSVGVIKNGGGTLTLAGPSSNTYGGTTTVNASVLQLDKLGFPLAATAIPGNLIIGDGVAAVTVLNLASVEIADSANLTINNSSLWDLNGNSDTIGTSLTLNGTGSVSTGSGTATMSPNATITANPREFLGNSISGNLNVGSGVCTITVNPFHILSGSLSIPASVSGTATITKNGAGFMSLSGANSFSGQMNVANGTLGIPNPLALGTTAGGTTVSNTATLQISTSVTNEALTIASTGTGLINGSGANTWVSPITLAAATTFEIDGVSLDLQGVINGSGGFTKIGAGTLRLTSSTPNSYAGDTTVNTGVLQLNGLNLIRHGTLTIGDGIGGANADVVRYVAASGIFGGPGGSTVVINNTGLLDLNGFNDDVGPIYMDGGTINTGTGTLSLFQPLATYQTTDATNGNSTINGNLSLSTSALNTIAVSNDLTINAIISDTLGNPLTKTGSGRLFVNGANTYTGLTVIQQGWLYANNSLSLGATNNGTVVSNNATLVVEGGLAISNESLTLNGVGAASNWGNLDSEGGGSNTNIWAGPITVNANSTIMPYESSVVLRLIGPISGTGGVIVGGGGSSGTLNFEGNTANTYLGLTTVSSGTLVLNKSAGHAIFGNMDISGTVRLAGSQQTDQEADVLVNGGGLFDFSTFNTYMDKLRGTGTVNFGVNGWTWIGLNNGSSEFDGSFTGTGFALGWTVAKTGTGTFTIGGNSSYTAGVTHVNGTGGKLVINGSQPQIPVIVDLGTTLGGSGTVGTIAADGIISPGNSPGILTSSNVTFTSSGSFNVQITGPNPGTDYDQLNVRGTINLASATLTVVAAFTTPVAIGQQFIIINNDGVDSITGTFSGLPEGATITVGNYKFTISYIGGAANDVVLTLTAIPGAVATSRVTSGDGNHGIDLNECNNLSLVISNTTGTPMTGINATLSTTTEGVLITQPYSTYQNIAASGKGTNTTSFQISTLPGFVCGTDINLQLSVDSSLGSFTMNFVQHTGEPAVSPNHYDNSTVTSLPDVGSINSTNAVSGFVGPLDKVTVAMYLTHTFDSDLTNISLIAPDGTTVLLSSANGGGGQNYGANCSPDASRTTFDDAAGTAITAGAAPFVGTFRPQSALSTFIGNGTPNGNWRLHIADGFGGSLGTLRCWSLFLYGTACSSGGGPCDTCLPPISGAITASDLLQSNRWNREFIVGSCGSPKSWSGFGGIIGTNYHYDVYTFTNSSAADACVTVHLQSISNLMAAAYLNNFNPLNISNNFLGDAGFSTGTDINSSGDDTVFSCTVPAGAQFQITVNEVLPFEGTQPYTLYLSGLPCPPPTLAIDPLIPVPNVRVHWSTSAGGYKLEGTPSLSPAIWTGVTNEPIVTGGEYRVTNSAPPVNQFYRLNKP